MSSHYHDIALKTLIFDTDSYPILVDSGTSHCMTFCKDDFIDTPVITQWCIHGLGIALALMKGTVQYSFQDDEGKMSNFTVKNCFYVPSLPIWVLSL